MIFTTYMIQSLACSQESGAGNTLGMKATEIYIGLLVLLFDNYSEIIE